uniref:Uncharacterized protein n=1 Tax=Ceratitis capitata TaxID=7213 RepID=W8AK45_CERCA
MDIDKKPCNRATCGNRSKNAAANKDGKRSPVNSSKSSGEPVKSVPPNNGNSTQILFVEPNFTETPSEYDVFYDCYSDVAISQQSHPVVPSVCGLNMPQAPVKDSRMFRDALKQVIVTAQTLLVEFDSIGRQERRGCGSRCRCDVRNIKPQTRTVQLEVTAKVTPNKSSAPSNIRIDPITFTIPLKLHVRGQHQHNIPNSVSKLSNEVRKSQTKPDREQLSNIFSSMEPIRTAIITAPRQEATCMPPEAAYNFHAALLQQMAGIPPGFLHFPPMQPAEGFAIPIPPTSKEVSSKVQIQVPQSTPLMTLGGPIEATTTPKSKGHCTGTCSVGRRVPEPSVEAFLSPSLAPVTKGPFLTTLATSSVPSVGPQMSSETRSQGVCVLCGRSGEPQGKPVEIDWKPPCGICSKGEKFVPPQPREFPSASQRKGTCGGDYSQGDRTAEPLVVLVPPVISKPMVMGKVSSNLCSVGGTQRQEPFGGFQGTVCHIGLTKAKPTQQSVSQVKQEESKRHLRGPCGKCSTAPPVPPPLEEPLSKVNGPCGVCSKPIAMLPEIPKPEKVFPSSSTTCFKDEVVEKPEQLERSPCEGPPAQTTKSTCTLCSKRSEIPVKSQCGICSGGRPAPMDAEKAPCGICSAKDQEAARGEKAPCGICSKKLDAIVTEEKAPCGICSKRAETQLEKGPCGICAKRSKAPIISEKAPCGICSKGVPAPADVEIGPCGTCSRGMTPYVVEEKGPCGICSRGAEPTQVDEQDNVQMEEVKGPCGVCSRLQPATVLPPTPMNNPKAPCGICTPTRQERLEVKGPCNICKRGPVQEERDICGICKKTRLPGTPPAIPTDIQPCGKCASVGAPCKICNPSAGPSSAAGTGACGACNFIAPVAPSSRSKTCGSCLTSPPKPSNIRTCGTCLPAMPPIIDRTCGTCLALPEVTPTDIVAVPEEKVPERRIYKALPQHKDIHICSPCHYDPSPLIDEDGNVFCPRECGCCLCPWRKRATDSQIDQIKHEKIKVCKCRMKGSIFADYTSRAKCSNTSYFDCCPCRERAEAKYLEMTGEEMWSPDDKLKERVRGEPVNLEDVAEYKRASTTN